MSAASAESALSKMLIDTMIYRAICSLDKTIVLPSSLCNDDSIV